MVYVIIIALVLYAFIVAGMWKIFEKAGVKGWHSLIPLWNTVKFYQLVKAPWMLGLHFAGLVMYIVAFVGMIYYGLWIALAFAGSLFQVNLGWEILTEISWVIYLVYGLAGVGFIIRCISHIVCSYKIVHNMDCPKFMWLGLWTLPFIFMPLLGFETEYTWKHPKLAKDWWVGRDIKIPPTRMDPEDMQL